MNTSLLRRIDPWLDRLLGLTLAGALAMVALTALPGHAMAADHVSGSGQLATEARSVGEFNAISVAGGINLKVRQGAQASVTATADTNLLPLLETVVEGDKTLQVRWKRGSSIHARSKTLVEIVAVQLRAIASAGSSDIDVDSVKAPQLALSISGAGDIRAKSLTLDEMSIAIAGSGDVSATGLSGKLRIKISGSGDVKTDGLKADDVSVSIAGSGDASVNAEKTLSVAVAGSGDVVYSGNAVVKSSVAGSGSVGKR